MEGFLERTGYAEDQICTSFAGLIGDAFFTGGKDILVSDESSEYRAPLIAALAEKYLHEHRAPEASQGIASLPARVLILAGHHEVLEMLKKLCTEEDMGCAILRSASDLSSYETELRDARIVAIPSETFLEVAQDERLRSREFTFLAIEGADKLSELPTEVQRKIWSCLLPPWERRTILFATHVGIRTKNLAIDFANNPTTVILKKAQAALNAISTSMYRTTSDRKFRLLLWLIQERARQGQPAVVVFCNLRQTSREVEARLRLNGISAEHISSAAPKQKNSEIFARFTALQDGKSDIGAATENTPASAAASADSHESESVRPFVLCVSNDNLEGVPNELALHGIHFDIPLDADIYLDRVRIMRTKGASMVGIACERYEVGLSAITSRFGTKFELLEPRAEMLTCADQSDGVPLELERPRREDDRRVSEMRLSADEGRKTDFARLSRDEQRAGRDHRSESYSNAKKSRPRDDQPGRRRDESRRSERQTSKEHDDRSLYSMSTEERLAFFRNKYKGILKTPASGQNERHGERSGRKPLSQSSPREISPQPSSATSTSAQPTPSSSVSHSESTGDSGAPENGGIVKRFIDKLFAGDKESGTDS